MLGDGVFGGKPEVPLGVQRILKAGFGEAADAPVKIMLPQNNAGSIKIVNQLALFSPVRFCHDQLRLCAGRNGPLDGAVQVAVSVPGNGDRLLPAGNQRRDALYQNRRAENRPVQNRADGAVRGFPHFFQAVFLHAVGVRGYGGALDAHAVLFRRVRRVDRHPVIRRVPVFQPQVVVFRFEVDIGAQKDLLDFLPEHARHFVPVHLDQRGFHLDFFRHSTVLQTVQISSAASPPITARCAG